MGKLCIALKRQVLLSDPCEYHFDPEYSPKHSVDYAAVALMHTIEGVCERLVCDGFGLDKDDVSAVLDETGTPSGWLPLLIGYEGMPSVSADMPPLPEVVRVSLESHERRKLSERELELTKARLIGLFSATEGDNFRVDAVEHDSREDEAELEIGARILMPAETQLGALSQQLGVHPVSVYWLLREGIQHARWQCVPGQRTATALHSTVSALRILGHRWPKQVEAREPAPDWADAEGIIPLTEGTGKSSLLDCFVERNLFRLSEAVGDASNAGSTVQTATTSNGMNGVLRTFAELMGKSLDQWLTTEFFKYHTSQFKKRPVAWQIQSNKFTAHKKPAFACLVYYHKLDGDLLEKIRTQYVGPLRQRWETELRGIESVAPAARSDRQTARRTKLGDLIKELQDFETCLRTVQESGFETDGLRQFAVQDALLCMKARWLRRLSETVQAGPLADWKTEAASAKIHENLPNWIDEALIHLDYHCSQVGPEEWKSADDPTPPSLAALICKEPPSLVASALEQANRRWRGRLDEEVLAPLRQEIGQKKETLKDVQAELKLLGAGNHDLGDRLNREERQIKSEIKDLKDKLDRMKDLAVQLRETITAWQCREAADWEPWLAAQPMYDAISSVDGRRRPPTTVMEWITQERSYVPDINDGVRVNIAPLQKAGMLAADVLAKKDLDKAIADRADWRADERRWCREGKLPQPGWWQET
jgi:hypothetical protein